MEQNFEPPVDGECVGRMSFGGKLFFYCFLSMPFLIFTFIVPFFCLFTHHFLLAILSFVSSSVTFFVLYKTISEFNRGWRLIYSNDGFHLHNYTKIHKIGHIILDNNTLEFDCVFEIERLVRKDKSNIIINTGYSFIIEKRFRDTPHLLVEFLNNHARNTTPLLEK